MAKITPLNDRVVAVREVAESKTKSGLYLPDNAKESPKTAVIESVGKDVKSVKKGEKIVFSYVGYKNSVITYDSQNNINIG